MQTLATTNSNIVGLAIAAVPTGTTADVVVTFNQTMLRAEVGLWSTDGLDCDQAPTSTGSSTATNPTANLNVPAEGFAIGACTFFGSGATTATWTGLMTERYDDTVETSMHASGASDNFDTAQSGLTMTCDSTSATQPAGVFASWGPAADPDPPTGATRRSLIIGGGIF